jgi:hypothetical protein
VTDAASHPTDDAAALRDVLDVPGGLDALLSAVLADEAPLEVVDETPVPPEWETLFAYVEGFLSDPEEEPSLMMKMAGKGVVAWGRKNVHQDPDKARAMMLELVRDTSRCLGFAPADVFPSTP